MREASLMSNFSERSKQFEPIVCRVFNELGLGAGKKLNKSKNNRRAYYC